ncbi:MAG: hypothetical protein K9K67_05865 [Bacteriovoracaceae bacterium]|nr:hypothetical protein [Bacteriovoracaceae bacterium]
MKVLLVVLSLFASLAVSADYDCYRKALNDFSVDSMAFQVKSEEAVVMFEDRPDKAVYSVIRSLEQNLGCSNKSFELAEVSCKEIVPGNALSSICYVESQHGYFFISMDMMESINVVFNRWD